MKPEYYDDKVIRDRILELVNTVGVSDREISLSIGMNENYINQLRTKKDPGFPLMQTFLDICSYFHITPVEFFYPTLENPAAAKMIYSELSRIGTKDTLEKLMKIFSVMDADQLNGLIKLFDSYKNLSE